MAKPNRVCLSSRNHHAVKAFLALHGQDPLRHISQLNPKPTHDATSRLADCRRCHSQFVRHNFRWQSINGCTPKRFPTRLFKLDSDQFQRFEYQFTKRILRKVVVRKFDTSRRTPPKSLTGYTKSRRLVLRIIRLFAIR